MFSLQPFNRTMILLSSMLLMGALWGFFRIPQANFLMVCFAFLSSALLMEIPSFNARLKKAFTMALFASTAQFLIAISAELLFWQLILSGIFAYYTFLFFSDHRAACIVMITGYLSLFAPPGFLPGISRSIDIWAGFLVIMAVTTFDNASGPSLTHPPQVVSFSPGEALILALELSTGFLLFRLLRLQQGPWIMLTLLFINMNCRPGTSEKRTAFQRISGVPLGIIIGGLLLGTFGRMDYRFIYVLPFIGSAAFWFLYNYNNFFVFSILFMVALTLFSDWAAGTGNRYNFWESFFSRSVSTLLGALPEVLWSQWAGGKKEKSV